MPYLFIGLGALVILSIAFFKTPVGKGIIGEFQVKIVLGRTIPNKKYVINNLMVVNDGKSSQIDHVLINRSGIFVIETKNYSGRIYGQEEQKEWTQVFNYGKTKNKFYNPIMQNKTHIYALSKLLERNDCFFSIIVFIKAQLMTETKTHVGYLSDIRRKIRKEKNTILSVDEMNQIYLKLMQYKNNPQISNRDHIKEINQMKQNIENNICPRCGKQLVLRTGQYGEFYGCSDYPKCKFKKMIK